MRRQLWGVLLGLLLGAVVGLYPFQEAVAPEPGFEIHGMPIPISELAEIPEEDWPLERFDPAPRDVGSAAAIALLGLVLTTAIARFGSGSENDSV